MKGAFLLATLISLTLSGPALAHESRDFVPRHKSRHMNPTSVRYHGNNTSIRFESSSRPIRYREADCASYAYTYVKPVTRRVWIPEQRVKIWVEPVYRTIRYHDGTLVQKVACQGYYTYKVLPGYFQVVDRY